ncbi:hypothetical protein FRC0470_00944 [Corynebacterium diphtheriae]|nr:hypothetical protein FRC0432_02191 [Corynebacterium diphtheriae]CAB0949239.1 hypothetical protein FRC0470_00944 [Corynebacterium diphtheriae]
MFKRSLASVAAVAIASGAVVAPANAMTVTINNDNMKCTFTLTDEEKTLIGLHQNPEFSKEEATEIKKGNVEKKLEDFYKQIEKDKKALEDPNLDDELKNDLMRKLEENKKKVTANEDFRNALTACIDGKAYNSDKSSGTEKPGASGKPGGTDQSGESQKPGGTEKPEDQGNPGAPGKPGGSKNPEVPGNPGDSNNPKAPSNPGVTPAPPSNDGAGIGVIFAGAIAAILGILAAALPIIKPMLPPQLRALLP